MTIESLDHLVLTVQDIDSTVAWYERTLGMQAVTFGDGRQALHFGSQKINLHPADTPITPHAAAPTPGSADLCFLTKTPLEVVAAHLATLQIPILEGPVTRAGATGALRSVCIADPDGSLIEIANSL